MYTIGHSYFPKSLDNQLERHSKNLGGAKVHLPNVPKKKVLPSFTPGHNSLTVNCRVGLVHVATLASCIVVDYN